LKYIHTRHLIDSMRMSNFSQYCKHPLSLATRMVTWSWKKLY